MAREPRQIAGIGTGEAVDRLVAVAHHAQVGPVAEPGAYQPQLCRADVLELVDEQMAEPPALRRLELLVVFERVGAPPDQIVEVDETAAPLLVLVALVDRGDLGRGSGGLPARLGGGGLVGLGTDEASLGPLDLAGELAGAERGFGALHVEHRHEDARLAFEDGRHRAVAIRLAATELRERDRMERARGDLASYAEASEPGDELARGLARERDCEHVLRVDAAVDREPGDATGQHACLARAGAGEDGKRRGIGRDRCPLRDIETDQQVVADVVCHTPVARRRCSHGATLPGRYDSNGLRPCRSRWRRSAFCTGTCRSRWLSATRVFG